MSPARLTPVTLAYARAPVGNQYRCRPEDTRAVFWFSMPLNILRMRFAWILAFPLGLEASVVGDQRDDFLKTVLRGWVAWRGRWTEIDP